MPVLVDLLVADDIGRDGRTLWELHHLHRDEGVVQEAIASLVRHGLVEEVHGLFGLTPDGIREVERRLDPEAVYIDHLSAD